MPSTRLFSSRLLDVLTRPTPLAFLVLVALGLGVTVLTFYPGYLTVDATFQFMQTRGIQELADWHPPVMAWLWRGVDRFIRGTGGMFLLQVGMFWVGLGLVAACCLRPSVLAGLSALVIGLWPPVFANQGAIWKDVQMDGALLLGLGLVLLASTTRSRLALLAAQLPFLYAMMLRHNALAALLPLYGWSVWVAWTLWGRTARWRGIVSGTLTLLLVHVGIAQVLTSRVIRPARSHVYQCLMLHDLAALSLASGHSLLPGYLADRGIGFEQLRSKWNEETLDPLIFGFENIMTHERADLRALSSTWLREIAHDPGTYLRHRLRVMRGLLAINREKVQDATPTDFDAPHLAGYRDVLGVPLFPRHPWHDALTSRLFAMRDSLLFRPWLYVLVLGVWTALALWRTGGRRWLALSVCASGLCYLAGYLPIAPAPEFRYMLWVVLTAMLAPLALAGHAPAASPARER